jgi:purine nucleosidase/pyrimidine-specific ribonucleoside hydrolase
MLRLIRQHPHNLTLVATGPLTNLALAIREDRETMKQVKEIYIMGGAFRVYGNTKTMTEFNVDVDPLAAKEVLELGVPVTIVPLDVTEQVRLLRPDAERRAREHPSRITEFIRDVTAQYMNYHVQHDGFDGCFLHDPLTVGVVLRDEFVDTVDAFVQVETEGEFTSGMTIADLRGHAKQPPNARVCMAVKARAFLEFFWERLRQD